MRNSSVRFHNGAAERRLQLTGWIEAILASGSHEEAFSIYEYCFFQPAADVQTFSGLCILA
jgi:hypothetical protein